MAPPWIASALQLVNRVLDKTHAVDITYIAGNLLLPMRAVKTQPNFGRADLSDVGIEEMLNRFDWVLIEPNKLVRDGVRFEPERNHMIVVPIGDGNEERFSVNSLRGLPCFAPSDGHETFIRCHTLQVASGPVTTASDQEIVLDDIGPTEDVTQV